MSRWQSKVYVNQLLGWSYNRTFPIFFMLQCKKSLTKISSPAHGLRHSQVLSKVCVNQFQTSTHTASSVSRSQPSFTITWKVHRLSKNKTQINYWICTEAHLNVFLHLVHFFFYSVLLNITVSTHTALLTCCSCYALYTDVAFHSAVVL